MLACPNLKLRFHCRLLSNSIMSVLSELNVISQFLRSLGQLFTDGQRQTRKFTTRSSTYCYWVNCILKQGIFISRNGMEKLSSRRERKKLCLMHNMYHGHAPSYLCHLLPPLVRDVANYPVRNKNDYTNAVNTATIRAASSCIFSSLSLSVCEQLSHISNKGLINVK
jgi:hypothetical protein